MYGLWRRALLAIVGAGFVVTGAHAAGGVYMDDFQVRNNGVVVFGDNFQDGNYAGWQNVVDAKVFNLSSNPQQPVYSLCLNQQHKNVARAYHKLGISNAGVVELSVGILAAPCTEQYNCTHRNNECALRIGLRSGNARSQINAIVFTGPEYTGCRISMTEHKEYHGSPARGMPLQFNKWGMLTMRLDPRKRTASVLLDGKLLTTMRYDPRKFASISEICILCSFGEGSARTD